MATTANVLVDGVDVPGRVGVLLSLHSQTVCFLLGGVAAGATVVVTLTPADLADCAVAFTDAASAQAALDAGVDDVLACGLTPFGTRPDGQADGARRGRAGADRRRPLRRT